MELLWLIWIICAFVGCFVAPKDRALLGFFLGLLLGPLGVLIAVLLPRPTEYVTPYVPEVNLLALRDQVNAIQAQVNMLSSQIMVQHTPSVPPPVHPSAPRIPPPPPARRASAKEQDPWEWIEEELR